MKSGKIDGDNKDPDLVRDFIDLDFVVRDFLRLILLLEILLESGCFLLIRLVNRIFSKKDKILKFES